MSPLIVSYQRIIVEDPDRDDPADRRTRGDRGPRGVIAEARHRLPPRLQRPAECGHGRAAHGGLGAGTYPLTIAVPSDASHLANNYDWWDKVIGFQIVPGSESSFIGSAWLPA